MTSGTATASALPGSPPAAERVRLLGLDVAERNRRVLVRSGRVDGRLEVPPGVAITPVLTAALPREAGVWQLVWDAGRPPIVWMVGAAGGKGAGGIVRAPAGGALDASTGPARRLAAARLLNASGKPTDGWISRHVHRRVSRIVSVLALGAGVTANQATLGTFAVGLAAAWAFALTGRASMAIGGLLFWLTSIVDGVDGEIARLTFTESAAGEQLDTVMDDLTYLACYAGVMAGWWRQGMGPLGAFVVAGTLAAILATVVWATRLVRRDGPRADRRVVPLTPIEIAVIDAAAATGRPLLRAAASFFQIFRRELFTIALFVVSLTTSRRAVLPIVVAAGLASALVVLLTCQAEIAAAMRARYQRGRS